MSDYVLNSYVKIKKGEENLFVSVDKHIILSTVNYNALKKKIIQQNNVIHAK